MPPKSRSKREQFTTLKNNDSAPSVRTPTQGRRLGGGANGGVSSDDPDDLRRVRLAALARQERKVAAAAAQGARKREATRAPGDAASLSVVGQAATRPSNLQSTVDDDAKSGGDLIKADECSSVTEMATTARVTAEAGLSAAAAAAVACTPGQITSAELFVLATTTQVIVRNARERPDRRSLKAANDGVWTKVCEKSLPSSFLDNEEYEQEDYAPIKVTKYKANVFTDPSISRFLRANVIILQVVRWPLGHKLLELAGFSATPPPCPGFSGVGVGSSASDDSAPLSTADPDVAAWRAEAVYTFKVVEENDSSSSSSRSANGTATEADGSAVANTTDTIGVTCAAAIEEVLATWITQNQALAAGNNSVNSAGSSGSNKGGGDGGKEAAAAPPAVAETKPQPALRPPLPAQQHTHQLLVGGALHGPAGPAVDWLRALGLER